MSKPAAKRLLDIIKRRRLKNKFTKFLPTVGKFGTLKKSSSNTTSGGGGGRPHRPDLPHTGQGHQDQGRERAAVGQAG